MKRLENYNKRATIIFVKRLFDLGLLEAFEDGFVLRTPLSIELPNILGKKVVASYKNNEETGGLFFAEVIVDDDFVHLEICNWHEVENVVELHCPGFSKRTSYLGDPVIYKSLLEENFSKSSKHILFPIHYHTHPTDRLESDVLSFSSVSKLRLSDADMRASENRSIKVGDYNIYYPNSIITGRKITEGLSEHRIIFYGKGISPYDFADIRMQQSANGMIETIKDLDGPWERLLGILGFSAYTVGAIAMATHGQVNLANDMKDVLADLNDKKEYFSPINSIGPTIVSIPKYSGI